MAALWYLFNDPFLSAKAAGFMGSEIENAFVKLSSAAGTGAIFQPATVWSRALRVQGVYNELCPLFTISS